MKKSQNAPRLTVPNDMSFLPVVLAFVREAAKLMGFEKDDLQRIEVGTEEAVSNILQHAFEPGQEETLELECEQAALGLNIVIREKGMPFDPASLPKYDLEKATTEFSAQGLGNHLLMKMMDGVSFYNLGRDGKETHLLKNLTAKPVQDYLPADVAARIQASSEQKPDTVEKIPYSVRLMKPEEAVDVAKCAYMSYGYTYVHDVIYYPERIRQLNDSGDLISIVAVADSGAIMGHIGLVADDFDRSVFEGGMAFVNPAYRGQGCLNRLLDVMFEEAAARGHTGVFGRATATHPFSQKGILKYDMHPCAVIISNLPPAKYKGIEQDSTVRRSSLYSFRYIVKPEGQMVYAPPHHRDMLEKLYDGIHALPEFAEPLADSSGAQHDASLAIESGHNQTATISVQRTGPGLLEEVRRTVKRLCADRVETIYLYLSLNDAAAAASVSGLEDLGFFFGGIFPGALGKDRLMLQYLNNQVYDYDSLSIASPLGCELLDYIRARDPNKDL